MDNRSGQSASLMSPAEAAAISIKETIAAVLRWLKLATTESDDAVEHVHQLRIAARRATAALELYDDLLPTGCTRKLQAELKKLRKLAGPIRDNDVLARHVTPQMFGVTMYSLAARLSERRKAARIKLAQLYEKWGRGERVERLTTEALCEIRPRRKQLKRDGESFASFARHRMIDARRAISQSMQVKLKRPERMHEFRIQMKALRYRLELLKPAFADDRYAKVYKQVKRISQQLGEINDLTMVRAEFSQWRKQLSQAATVKLLKRAKRHEGHALRQAQDKFSNWWSSKRQRRLRRHLKKLVDSATQPIAIITPPTMTPRMRPAK